MAGGLLVSDRDTHDTEHCHHCYQPLTSHSDQDNRDAGVCIYLWVRSVNFSALWHEISAKTICCHYLLQFTNSLWSQNHLRCECYHCIVKVYSVLLTTDQHHNMFVSTDWSEDWWWNNFPQHNCPQCPADYLSSAGGYELSHLSHMCSTLQSTLAVHDFDFNQDSLSSC